MKHSTLLTLLLLAGCSGAPADFPREPVEGQVTLDGRPLDEGLITLEPVDQPEPIASGVITEGRFTIARVDGPAPGRHRVSIWSQKPTGKKLRDPDQKGQLVEEIKSVIPDRYNARTELVVEIKPGASNSLEFPLSKARTKAGGSKTAQASRNLSSIR